MKNVRVWALLALLALAPAMTSCRLFRKSRRVAPPAPAPVPTETQPSPVPAKAPPPPPVAPPPAPQPEESQKPREPATVSLPAPPRARKKPSPAGPRVQQPPAQSAPTAPAAAPPAPQLRPMLTPDQRSQLEHTTIARLQRARQALASLKGRPLTQDQQEVVSQIRTFLRQAEEARPADLVRAGNLAERADVLAQDLLRSLK